MDGWIWDVSGVLPAKEQEELVRRSCAGDFEASAMLVMGNLRLILFLASKMARSESDKKDLIGEGLLGAWVAATRFDPSHNVKFCTYAVWWIRSYMVQYIKKSRREMREFPNTHRIKKEVYREYLETGRSVDDASVRRVICERMQIGDERLQELLDAMNSRKLCLDMPAFDDGGPPLSDHLEANTVPPDEECMAREEREIAAKSASAALAILSEREAAVMRFTVMMGETFEAAGKRLGVSKQRAKQISDKAIRKMKDHLCSSFHGPVA